MRNIKCVAIDDEPIALEVVSQFCNRLGGIDIFTFSEPEEGIKAISEQKPEIVFLDIEMNDVSGLQIARQIPEDICCIFSTAYMEYALDGFNLDVVDFLHKPFSYERFCAAVEKALRRLDYRRMTREKKSIIVKHEYNNVPVSLTDIIYIEAMENYSKIFLADSRMVLAHNSLKSIYDQIESDGFIRIHDNLIASMSD